MAAPQRRARSPLQQQLRTRATIRASAVLRLPTGTRRFFSLLRSARRPPDGPAKAPSTTPEGPANRAKGRVLRRWHRRGATANSATPSAAAGACLLPRPAIPPVEHLRPELPCSAASAHAPVHLPAPAQPRRLSVREISWPAS